MRVENENVKIYFKIPFTMYFIGKSFIEEDNYKSKIWLITKRFDVGGYYYWNIIK